MVYKELVSRGEMGFTEIVSSMWLETLLGVVVLLVFLKIMLVMRKGIDIEVRNLVKVMAVMACVTIVITGYGSYTETGELVSIEENVDGSVGEDRTLLKLNTEEGEKELTVRN